MFSMENGERLGVSGINCKIVSGAWIHVKCFWWKRLENIYLGDLEPDIYSNTI